MRILSWNMAYWKRGHFNSLTNRKAQWKHLLEQHPDIALLQECRPDDLPTTATQSHTLIGSIPSGWTACSALLVRHELQPQTLCPTDRIQSYFSGYIARAQATIPSLGEILLASVHTPAKIASGLSPAEHQRMRRQGCKYAWNNDLAAHELRQWSDNKEFLIGGDWNTCRGFGTASGRFFDVTASWGWKESLRKYYPAEQQTYFDKRSKPYELDHLFSSAMLHQRLSACTITNPNGLSDHAMLLFDF